MQERVSQTRMEDGQKPRIRGMLLVWLIGLTLGVLAGAATAMLLMPKSDATTSGETIADRLRKS